MKSTLKERVLKDTEDIERTVTKELLALLADESKKCFQQFYDRSQKYVASEGDYLEEY
jgi:hypothetical protein